MTSLENADFRLEQAEYKKDEEFWEIVVSYLVENVNKLLPAFAAIASNYNLQRIYKLVKIDKNNNVLGFYIFEKPLY